MKENSLKFVHVAVCGAALLASLGLGTRVSSQVHQSSAGTAAFARLRVAGLGIHIYAGDFDDSVPFADRGGVGLGGWGVGRPDYLWYELVEPYVLADYIPTESPFDPLKLKDRHLDVFTGLPLPPNDPNYWYSAVARSNVALNYDFFSPWIYNTASRYLGSAPIHLSESNQPSNTLMLINSVWDRDASGNPIGGGSWVVDAPCIKDENNTVLQPIKRHLNEWFSYGGWSPGTTSWLEFGGAWPWYEHKKFAYLMQDMSARATDVGTLTAGCDVQSAHAGAAFDGDAYIWDLR